MVNERTKELEVAKSSLETAKSSLEADVAKRTEELEKAKSSLEEEVAKRTAELNVKLEENIKMNKYMVGRENKMAELKKKLQDAGIS
jgi:C4-dicarboxylate-specific signal transduction histidine kinase